jgi:hypothetical protein
MKTGKCHFEEVNLAIENFRHLGIKSSSFMGHMVDGHSHSIVYAREPIDKKGWYKAERELTTLRVDGQCARIHIPDVGNSAYSYGWVMDVEKLEVWKRRNLGFGKGRWEEAVMMRTDRPASIPMYGNGVGVDLNKNPIDSRIERLIPRSAAQYFGGNFLEALPVYRSIVNFADYTRGQE